MKRVRKALYQGQSLTDKEAEVVAQLATLFRPWTPKARLEAGSLVPPPACAALGAPLLYLSNTLLKILGCAKFQRTPCPEVSPATPHALQLNTTSVYECFISRGSFRIDGVTSNKDCTLDSNSSRIWSSFFDRQSITQLCEDHGIIKFRNRLTFVDKLDVHLSGTPKVPPPPPPPPTPYGSHAWLWHDAFVDSGKSSKELKDLARTLTAKSAALPQTIKNLAKQRVAKAKDAAMPDLDPEEHWCRRMEVQDLDRTLISTRKTLKDIKSQLVSCLLSRERPPCFAQIGAPFLS